MVLLSKTDIAPADYGTTRFSTRNSTSINRKKYLDASTIPNVDYDLLYTGELAGFYKGLRFETAYIANDTHIQKDAPASVNKTTKHFWGWYAQTGYLLFGGTQRYDANGNPTKDPHKVSGGKNKAGVDYSMLALRT